MDIVSKGVGGKEYKMSRGRGFNRQNPIFSDVLGIVLGCKTAGGGDAGNMLDEGDGVLEVVGPRYGKNKQGKGVLNPNADTEQTRSVLLRAAKFQAVGVRGACWVSVCSGGTWVWKERAGEGGFEPQGPRPSARAHYCRGLRNLGGGDAGHMWKEGDVVLEAAGHGDRKNERGEGVLTPWARYRRTRSLLPWAAKFRRWGCRAYVESG